METKAHTTDILTQVHTTFIFSSVFFSLAMNETEVQLCKMFLSPEHLHGWWGLYDYFAWLSGLRKMVPNLRSSDLAWFSPLSCPFSFTDSKKLSFLFDHLLQIETKILLPDHFYHLLMFCLHVCSPCWRALMIFLFLHFIWPSSKHPGLALSDCWDSTKWD